MFVSVVGNAQEMINGKRVVSKNIRSVYVTLLAQKMKGNRYLCDIEVINGRLEPVDILPKKIKAKMITIKGDQKKAKIMSFMEFSREIDLKRRVYKEVRKGEMNGLDITGPTLAMEMNEDTSLKMQYLTTRAMLPKERYCRRIIVKGCKGQGITFQMEINGDTFELEYIL